MTILGSMASFASPLRINQSSKATAAVSDPSTIVKVTSGTPFRLLDLPAGKFSPSTYLAFPDQPRLELRNHIYEMALSEEQHGRRVTMRQTWSTSPVQLYSNRLFMGLTQVNRIVRKEFSPHRYHTSYTPHISFYQLSPFLSASPFLDGLEIDVPAMLDDLKAPLIHSIDILPLTEIDWKNQPFSMLWPKPEFASDRALFVASCIALACSTQHAAEEWDALEAIDLSKGRNLVTLNLVWKPIDNATLERIMDRRKAFVNDIIRETGILQQSGVCIESACGPFSFRAEDQALGFGRLARGRWLRSGRRWGPDESYYGFRREAVV